MQIHRLCNHLPQDFITPFLQGKTDALVRLKLKLWTKIQKTGLSCLQSNACRVLPITEDNSSPDTSTALLCWRDQRHVASHISLHPHNLQNTSSRHFCSQLYCFSELLFKERQPLQKGQSSSAPQSYTVPCQAVAVCSEQMDFPAVGNTSGNRILV